MRNIEKYYDNTKDAMPNYTVKKFIELNIKPSNAIELGCGAGRDTVYLIKNDGMFLQLIEKMCNLELLKSYLKMN